MSQPAVFREVVKCEDKMLITERNYEKRTRVIKNHWECLLSCGHWEYRTFSTMHNEPKTLACSCCSGGELTRREIMQSNKDAVPFVAMKASKKAKKS